MYKRILFLSFLILMLSVPAFATITTEEGKTIKADDTGTSLISKLSSGVIGQVNTNAISYAVATKATKGNKIYGSSAQDTSIFVKDSVVGTKLTATLGLGASVSDSAAFSGDSWVAK